MLRQSLMYLALSILIVVFAQYAKIVIVYIDMIYTYINLKLTPIFSRSELGIVIRDTFTLVFIPVLVVGTPALVYRLIKKRNMPYFIEATWLLWLVVVLSKVIVQ